LTGTHIAKAVVNDTRSIMPVTTCVRGMKGIEEDVFISMPAALGSTGVQRVIDLPLTPKELEKFQHSVKTIWNIQKNVWNNI
jgi:malate/lactate dehydrogenase